jgi:transcriptional regulator with XRE-family HTH domain
MSGDDWARRAELGGLLRACRVRLVRPLVPGARRGGMRQEDVAGLAGVSVRMYGAFERGDYPASAQVVDRIAAALQMSEAERSALHVLASRQDPPRRLTRLAQNLPGEQDQALRDLVTCSPYAAALTDETWTVMHYNRDMSTSVGGWFESVVPADRHLVAYLFSGHAEASMPDIRAVRRASIAWLRYQYARNLSSPGFTGTVERLLQGSPAAAELWSRRELAFPPHLYPVRIRHPGTVGIVRANVLFTPVTPRVWTYTMIMPPHAAPVLVRSGFAGDGLVHRPVAGPPADSVASSL